MPALNLTYFLYGTELPDKGRAQGGMADNYRHHVYFSADGIVRDDASAQRAQEELDKAVNFSRKGDLVNASLSLGMMTHYISDVASFGHVMGVIGNTTYWGAEDQDLHERYEKYVNVRTDNFTSEFSSFLVFDGVLANISAYDATIFLANDTTFDSGKEQTCVWMYQHYNLSDPWSDQTFENRCGESLNLATNLIADVLHTFRARTRLVGDVNGDDRVDMKDISYVAIRFWCFPGNSTWNSVADINADGRIDMRDIALAVKHFGEHYL
jgi:hypothetical protein